MTVELRAHTCFSFSDGAVSSEDLAHIAHAYGYTHIGITDTADLGGLARFGYEAKELTCADGKPLRLIAGAELVVDGHPAAFLARSREGYKNLAALVTIARMGQWSSWDQKAQA